VVVLHQVDHAWVEVVDVVAVVHNHHDNQQPSSEEATAPNVQAVSLTPAVTANKLTHLSMLQNELLHTSALSTSMVETQGPQSSMKPSSTFLFLHLQSSWIQMR
jgi:hypothetical protein